MSRSNNNELTNPATKFFQWDGTKGGLKYFDKTKGEKGENVSVGLPFNFVVLDTLSTIKGYNDAEQSGYWSNEVRDTTKDILMVRTKKGLAAKGLYEQVIADRNCRGAKYCQSVYIAINEGGKFVIANMQMMGAALSAWIEFRKKNRVFEIACSITGSVEGKKGATVYQIPVFAPKPILPETNKIAVELDNVLQTYLNAYLKNKSQEVASDNTIQAAESSAEKIETAAPVTAGVSEDDLPF